MGLEGLRGGSSGVKNPCRNAVRSLFANRKMRTSEAHSVRWFKLTGVNVLKIMLLFVRRRSRGGNI